MRRVLNRRGMHSLFLAITTSTLMAACGLGGEETPPPKTPLPPAVPSTATGDVPHGPTEAPSGSAPAAKGGPRSGEWQVWSPEQKGAWMKAAVLPRMHDLFAAVDASKYGEMTCKTCHGVGAMEGSFQMPNPGLPKLDPKPAAFKTLEQANPRMFNFMATLLAVQPHDMKTNTGFSCFNCHTKK